MKQTILTSLEAHRKFVLNRIDCPKGQIYYQEMMIIVQNLISTSDNYPYILAVLNRIFVQLRDPLFNKELKYKRLALEHASDVIISVNKRFGNAQS